MKSEFLGEFIREISIRNIDPSRYDVYSVTSESGFIKSTDFFKKEIFSKDLSNYKVVAGNQFAYNPSRVNVGSIDYLTNPSNVAVSPLYVVFECDDRLRPEYLKRFLKSPLGKLRINAKTKGAVRQNLSFSNLSKIKLQVPSLEQQDLIIDYFRDIDDLISHREESMRLYELLLKSLFNQFFGTIQNNTKKFPVVKIQDVSADIKDGPHVSPEYSENGIPFLSSRNIKPGELILNDVKYVSEETYKELTRNFCPQKNDVLLTKGGTTGHAKAVDFDYPFCVWVHLAVIRPNDQILPLYLEYWLNSDYGYFQSQKRTKGAANRDLGLKKIATIELLLPPLGLQEMFVEVARNFQFLKKEYKESLNQLEILSEAFSQKIFTGRYQFDFLPSDNGDHDSKALNTPSKVEEIGPKRIRKGNSDKKFDKSLVEIDFYKLIQRTFKYEHFTFNHLRKVALMENGELTFDDMKNSIFALLREGKLRQIFADSSYKSENRHTEDLEEQIYLHIPVIEKQ